MAAEELYVGIDIGGSSVKVGVVADSGQIRSQATEPLPLHQGRDASLDALFTTVERCVGQCGISMKDVRGIGVAAPGTMDLDTGVIFHPFNLAGWENLSLRDLVSERFGQPAVLQNDANAAAFGEFWVGGAAGADSLMFWTLGTGVGGGIILHGEILTGAHFHAGECGHMIIQMEGGPRSEFGIHGSLELYAGARALVRRCEQALDSGARSMLSAIRDERELTAIDIADAALEGDELAWRLVLETARYIAIGTVNVIHILNPAVVLVGGAMTFGQESTELGRAFLEEVRRTVRSIAFPIPAERTRIDFATLGNAAGFIGAAGCARRAFRRG